MIDQLPAPAHHVAGGMALVRFAEQLAAARALADIERAFLAGIAHFFDAPIYGFNVFDAEGRCLHVTSANVSDVFLARYRRDAMHVDPVLARAMQTRRATSNGMLMSAEEWLESPVYRAAHHLHGIRHVVEAPVVGSAGVIGNVHLASDGERAFSPDELQLAEALAGLLGVAIDSVQTRDRLQHEHDRALAALALAGTAVVTTEPGATDLALNDAALRLVGDVIDADEHLHRLLARSAGNAPAFSRRRAVELTDGARGVLHAHVMKLSEPPGAIVATLELSGESDRVPTTLAGVLTPREHDVATLVSEGLTDREIAVRLFLSHHTVSQYVKRIYRKVGVGSRVELARLLLGAAQLAL